MEEIIGLGHDTAPAQKLRKKLEGFDAMRRRKNKLQNSNRGEGLVFFSVMILFFLAHISPAFFR
jgi:hypothetical protein